MHPAALLFATFFSLGSLLAQDPSFSQFASFPVAVNPALAGISDRAQITAIFRDQWPAFPQTYVSYALGWDQYFDQINSAFGVQALGDRQGDGVFSTYSLSLYYAYNVRLGRNAALRAGLEFSWAQRSLQWDQLQFFDQIDPVFGFNDPSGVPNPTAEIPPGDPSLYWFDGGSGVLVFSRKLYAGVSIRHLARPNAAFYTGAEDRIPIAWSAQAGATLPFGQDRDNPLRWSPYLLWQSQARFQQARAGMRLGKGPLFGGTAFRYAFSPLGSAADAFIAEAGLRQKGFEMTYSYDVSVGPVAGQSGGAHEVSIKVGIAPSPSRSNGRRNAETLQCPVF